MSACVLVILGAVSARAQFGFSTEIAAQSADYSLEIAPTGRAAAVAQLNAQGASGRRLIGPLFFSGENTPEAQSRSLFVSDAAQNQRYDYHALAANSSGDGFLSQLNAEGAQGFEFTGPFITDLASFERSHFFVHRTGSSSIVEYRLEPAATSTSFGPLIESLGAQGWEWLSSYVVNEDPFNADTRELFIRRVGQKEIFTYQTLDTPADRAGALAQLNRQGASGYRWLSPVTFGGGGIVNLFIKNTLQNITYRYAALAAPDTQAGLLGQANAQGDLGAYYKGGYTFSAAPFSVDNIYVTPGGRSAPSGRLSLVNGAVFFLPEAAGSFQLQTSTELLKWDVVGSPQTVPAGGGLLVSDGLPAAPQRFYRIVTP